MLEAMLPGEKNRAAFLGAVFNEIFALGDGTIVTGSIGRWLPDAVRDKLELGGTTTTPAIVDLCRTNHVIDETFVSNLSKLHENWDLLMPDRKANLIALIHNHELEGHFEPYMLSLSPTDQEGLRIRWDAAEILFDQEKQKTFNRARIDGNGRRDLFSLGKLDEVIEILLELLAHKADYDLAAVILGAPAHVRGYLPTAAGKCQSEYLNYLGELRDLHRAFLLDVRRDLSPSVTPIFRQDANSLRSALVSRPHHVFTDHLTGR